MVRPKAEIAELHANVRCEHHTDLWLRSSALLGLQMQIDEVRLPGMRRSLHPRSRVFRCLLILALLAWAAFAFDAVAHPLAVADGMGSMAGMAMGHTTSSHCNGMTPSHASTLGASTPAPSHPAGTGHGCCAFGHCLCATFCSGIAGVSGFDVTWEPPHDPALVPAYIAPTSVRAAPPLRPPIV